MTFVLQFVARGGDQVKNMLAGIGAEASKTAANLGRAGRAGIGRLTGGGATGGGTIGDLLGGGSNPGRLLGRLGGGGGAGAVVGGAITFGGLMIKAYLEHKEREIQVQRSLIEHMHSLTEGLKSAGRAANSAANGSLLGAAGSLRSLSRYGEHGIQRGKQLELEFGPGGMQGAAALAKAGVFDTQAVGLARKAAGTNLISFGDAASEIAKNRYLASATDQDAAVARILRNAGFAGIKAGDVPGLVSQSGEMSALGRLESAQGAINVAGINRAASVDTLGPLREELRAITSPSAVAMKQFADNLIVQRKMLDLEVANQSRFFEVLAEMRSRYGMGEVSEKTKRENWIRSIPAGAAP